ncbi:hypothetical protein AT6N2_C2110 [Agrobacterium tumefaciens]|nr:hypothetical protein AT6N2_C2110 [Agrobacterium tumefaciens]
MVFQRPAGRKRFTATLHPVGRNAVIVIDLAILGIKQVIIIKIGKVRRVFDLLLGEVDPIAVQFLVIVELFPRQRVIVVANPKEAAEAQHGVGNTATTFFEDDPLDRTDVFAVSAVDAGALYLVAGDEARRVLDVGVLTATGFLMQHDSFLHEFLRWCHVM